MSGAELLRVVVSRLDDAGIPFMLTGSMAAAIHGAQRSTMDIDLVIESTGPQLSTFVASIAGADLYVSADAAQEALRHESMFNVVDARTGWKADLIVRKTRPFSEAEFARRSVIDFEGTRLWVATVEDLIVAKLEWARLGGSARQVEDVSELLRIAGKALDRAYVEQWIDGLQLRALWRQVLDASEAP